MARQKNAFLTRIQNEYAVAMRRQRNFTILQSRDMLAIAANEALGLGPERVGRLLDAYDAVLTEYADMVEEDSRDDRSIEYTRAKVDKRLESVLGERFEPWQKRYAEIWR